MTSDTFLRSQSEVASLTGLSLHAQLWCYQYLVPYGTICICGELNGIDFLATKKSPGRGEIFVETG